MKKYKKRSKSQIDKMSTSEKKEYYEGAVEYYGNLKNQLKWFCLKGIVHPLLWLCVHATPIKVIKLNNIDWNVDNNPIIFSANHSNAYDMPILSLAIKKHIFVLCDYTTINNTIADIAFRMNGCVYIDRKTKESKTNAYEQCVAGIKQGYNMLIFPESTWNLTKSLPILPRYWGDIKIAQETGTPIIPTRLVYCGRVCLIKFGKRIYVSKNDSIAEKDNEVYDAMVQLRKEIEVSPEYKKYYVPIEYTDWVKKNINSYKFFDVDYEMSCIRNCDIIPHDEFEQIKRIGAEIRPVDKIREKLRYARINYRYKETDCNIE